MAIFVPGRRNRHNRPKKNVSRKIVAMLSLTAMVDMFTVLTIFLLQNYRETGEILHIPKDVVLPQASATKELSPSKIVIITQNALFLDKEELMTYDQIKTQKDWLLRPLFNRLATELRRGEIEFNKKIKTQLKGVVEEAKGKNSDDLKRDLYRVTLEADKGTDFLTVKKIMYTITESGSSEINFAVIQVPRDPEVAPPAKESEPSESI